MAGLIIALFVLCGFGFMDVGKAQQQSAAINNVAADIEMALVAEQIALNAITSLIEQNKRDIAALHHEVKRASPGPRDRDSQTGVVKCVEDNDFDEKDSEGNRRKRVKVTFKKPYELAPSVLASVQRLEIPKESDRRFEVRVENVTIDDFTLVCLSRGNETDIQYASVSYLSVPKK